MSDAYRFLADIDSREAGNRLRLGMATVRSVEGDPVYGTATGQCVIVPATAEWGVDAVAAQFLGEYPPRPGGLCWYATDGTDRIVLGMVAPEGPPIGTIDIAAATAIPNNTLTTIVAATRTLDPWNMSDGTGFVVPVSGMYQLTAQVAFASNATGWRQVSFVRGSTTLDTARVAPTTSSAYVVGSSRPIACSKGDTLSVKVWHTAGADLNVNEATISAAYLGRRRTSGVGPELLRDGGFEDRLLDDATDPTWSTSITAAGNPTFSLDTGANAYAGSYSLKGVYTGTVLSGIGSAFSNTVLAVVPRQRLRITARVKTSVAITALLKGIQVHLHCTPDGTAFQGDPEAQYVAGSMFSTTTSFALYTWDITVPDGCFVARVVLGCDPGAAATVWWDDVSCKEIIA